MSRDEHRVRMRLANPIAICQPSDESGQHQPNTQHPPAVETEWPANRRGECIRGSSCHETSGLPCVRYGVVNSVRVTATSTSPLGAGAGTDGQYIAQAGFAHDT